MSNIMPMSHSSNVVVGISAARRNGKTADAKPAMTSEEMAAAVGQYMVDPKEVANAKHVAEQEKKAKDEALEMKLADERHKELQEAQDQGEQAAASMEKVIKLSQDLVRLQFEYKKAAPDEKEAIKAKALATGVLQLEAINRLLEPIKASKSTALGRLKSVWEFEGPDITALLKERKVPKVQLELDLATQRSKLDILHGMCEANGAARTATNMKPEPDEKEKPKRKATGKDAAANQGDDDREDEVEAETPAKKARRARA